MTATQAAAANLTAAREALRLAVITAEQATTPRARKAAWNAVELAESTRDFARNAVERAIRAEAAGSLTEAQINAAVIAA